MMKRETALAGYQIFHGLLGLGVLLWATLGDGRPFLESFAATIPHPVASQYPALVFAAFALAAGLSIQCNLPVLPNYFISFDAAVVLTLFFSGAFGAAAWVAALAAVFHAVGRVMDGAPAGRVFLHTLENAGNRALRYLAGAWIYQWAGGSAPLGAVSIETGFFDAAARGWGPAVLAMAAILAVNNLFFLPADLIRGASVRVFARDLVKVDLPLHFVSLPLGLIGTAVYTRTSILTIVLLAAVYLGGCRLASRLKSITDRLKRNLRRIEALAEANRMVTTTLYARSLVHLIGDAGQRLMDADGFVVALHDPATGRLSVEHAAFLSREVPPDVYGASEEMFRRVLAGKAPAAVTPDGEHPLHAETLRAFGSIPDAAKRSFLLAPMLSHHGVAGVLTAVGKPGEKYTEDDAVVLNSFAHQAAISFVNARLFERATVDDLTQLFMRHYFLERVREFAHESLQGKPPFAVALADMDKLKEINDQHGHAEGDRILMSVADVLRRSVPPQVMVARYGGDEFALLIPDATEVRAVEIIEDVRRSVAAAPEMASGQVRATISFGVAVYPPKGFLDGAPTPGVVTAGLLYEADAAMYRAKREGGNCTVLFRP